MTKRQSLATFAPITITPASPSNVHKLETSAEPMAGKKYHSIQVYLTEQEVRTIKLEALERGKRYSDIAAQAIREWLERNGHKR